jgi:hypothetical protein
VIEEDHLSPSHHHGRVKGMALHPANGRVAGDIKALFPGLKTSAFSLNLPLYHQTGRAGLSSGFNDQF